MEFFLIKEKKEMIRVMLKSPAFCRAGHSAHQFLIATYGLIAIINMKAQPRASRYTL